MAKRLLEDKWRARFYELRDRLGDDKVLAKVTCDSMAKRLLEEKWRARFYELRDRLGDDEVFAKVMRNTVAKNLLEPLFFDDILRKHGAAK
jgi:hypothetical protein